jgi:hypothetical protein
MRKIIISLAAAGLILWAAPAPASPDETEVEKADVQAVNLEAIASPRDGKNVALTLEARPRSRKQLPRGLSVVINGKQVNLTDDGAWPDAQAGDGVYTAAGRTRNGRPFKDRVSLRLQQSAAGFEFAPVSAAALGCTFRSVTCGAGCKSIIFRTKCVVCFELESCEIGF